MPQVEHLSASSVEEFTHCGERYRLKRIEGLREPRNSSLIRGSAVDAGVNKNMENKMAHRDQGVDRITLGEITEYVRDTVEAEFTIGEVRLDEEEAPLGLKTVKGSTIDLSVQMHEAHFNTVAPDINPTAVQERITVTMPGYPKLIGISDLEDDGRFVRDLKTSKRSPDQAQIDRAPQFSQYALNHEAKHKKPPEGIIIDTLVQRPVTKTRRVAFIEPLKNTTHRTREQLKSYLDRVATIATAIERGVFVPASTMSDWKCSARFCGFYGSVCRYTKGMK